MKELVIYNYSFLIEGAMLTLSAGKQNKVWFARLIMRDKALEVSFDSNVCFVHKDMIILNGNRFSKSIIDCNLSFNGITLSISGSITDKSALPNASGILGRLGLYRCNYDVFGVRSVFCGTFSLGGKDYGLCLDANCHLIKGEGILSNFAVLASTGLFFSAGSNKLLDLEIGYWTAGIAFENRLVKFSKYNSKLRMFEDGGTHLQINITSNNSALNIFTALDGEYTDSLGIRRSVLANTRFRLIENGIAFDKTNLPTFAEIYGMAKIKSSEPFKEAHESEAKEVKSVTENLN